jgi:energy-coupling factor transport system ATP-binding protein
VVFENVAFDYPGANGIPALDNITLRIDEGEFIAVAGLNGSGKSTLCRLINALFLPTRGKVLCCGLDTSLPENLADIRTRVGLVMQNPDNQIVGPTVEDDVAFGPENLGFSREEIGRRVEEALQALELADMRGREPHLLSFGERKRLALAGVMALGPRIIVSDESTSMLDPPTRAETIELFRRLQKEAGITVVHATHRPEEILEADRVALLESGHLLFTGKPEELFEDENLAAKHGLRPPSLYVLVRELGRRGYRVPGVALEAEEVAERLWASR